MDHDLPAYLRIAAKLRAKIVSGDLVPGDRLPSIPDLITSEHVSDITARKATRVLVSEGLAISKQGSGTFVRDRPVVGRMIRSWPREATGGSPFAAEMERQGKVGTWDYETETVQAPQAIRERLALPEPDGDAPDVVRTSYVFRADGEPTMLSTSWEPLGLTRGTPVVFPEDGPYEAAGVVERMRAIDVAVTHMVEELAPRPVLASEAAQLNIPTGALAQTIERTYWADDRPVETADIVIPADRYRVVYAIPVRDE